jgi:hypothetical protein
VSRTRAAAAAGLAGAALAVFLALLPADLPAGLTALALIAAPVVLALGLRSSDPRRRRLLALFALAVGLRALVAVLVHYGTPPGFFALDDQYYTQVGTELAQAWTGREARPPELHGATGYYRWNALLFVLLGPTPLAPALANAAIGGLCVLLAFGLAADLAGARAARLAGALTALWPSLVLWSSLNLKDALAMAAILSMLRGAQHLQGRTTARGIALLLAGLAVLSQLRGYLVLVAAASIALAWVLPRLRAAPVVVAPLLLAAALGLPTLGPVQELAAEQSLETVDQARSQLATGGSAYHSEADVSTASGALRFLPVGLAYFLLAPAPWQVWNTRQLLTLPEMLAWYALLPFVALGAAAALRQRFAAALPLASFALLATLSYALVEGNLGTAYRHRAQVLVPLLVFGAVGWARRREARGAPDALAAPGWAT